MESYGGFAFYLAGTLVVSALLFALRTESNPRKFFYSPVGDLWVGDLMGGALSFILTWTLFYGMVRA